MNYFKRAITTVTGLTIAGVLFIMSTTTPVQAGGTQAFCTNLARPFDSLWSTTQGFSSSHKAIDLNLNQGTAVKSPGFGVVISVTKPTLHSKKPSRVAIMHPDHVKTVYSQLSRVDVKVGQFVGKGQVIGLSGGTPNTAGAYRSSAAHLHLEVVLGHGKTSHAVDPTCIVDNK